MCVNSASNEEHAGCTIHVWFKYWPDFAQSGRCRVARYGCFHDFNKRPLGPPTRVKTKCFARLEDASPVPRALAREGIHKPAAVYIRTLLSIQKRRHYMPPAAPQVQLKDLKNRFSHAMVILNLIDRRSRRKGLEYSGPQKWFALGSDDRMIDTIKKVVAP